MESWATTERERRLNLHEREPTIRRSFKKFLYKAARKMISKYYYKLGIQRENGLRKLQVVSKKVSNRPKIVIPKCHQRNGQSQPTRQRNTRLEWGLGKSIQSGTMITQTSLLNVFFIEKTSQIPYNMSPMRSCISHRRDGCRSSPEPAINEIQTRKKVPDRKIIETQIHLVFFTSIRPL